jgi:tetratricopeptide (TPR) repeat protein
LIKAHFIKMKLRKILDESIQGELQWVRAANPNTFVAVREQNILSVSCDPNGEGIVRLVIMDNLARQELSVDTTNVSIAELLNKLFDLATGLAHVDRGAARGSQRIAPSKLPPAPPGLFGRDARLAALDAAWNDPATHVVTIVAWGGVGKTALVGTWTARLAARDFDGADYFDWSFYSQGTRERGSASADPFVDAALRFFGDADMADSPRSPWDKGARLAELVAARRTLLVLDGLEPLQHPPGPLRGELKDDALRALLRGLATRNLGLCVVTTRESVEDLAGFRSSTAPEWKLEHLSSEAGVDLLETLGVEGTRGELQTLVHEVRGHALTLNLLGRFLHEAFEGDVRQRDRIDFDEVNESVQGGHAFRVMEAYERWFEAEGDAGARQLAILRLLGLFDRPADPDCLAALLQPPAIASLTDALVSMRETQWNQSVTRLQQAALLVRDGDALDAHPLVREHFARQLQEEHAIAWKEAHGRLFDHLKNSTEHHPDTLEGLRPLYQAVIHGCHAGRYKEACDDVYLSRILRSTGIGADGFYSTQKLGAFGADLGAVVCFFDEPWSRVSPSLTKSDQAWLLNQAAFRLRALGRLREAIEPMRAGLLMAINQEDWTSAAIQASNLSELELTLGDVAAAVRDAEQSVDFADRSGDDFHRIGKRTTLADALHQAGRQSEALQRFREAETMQAEWQPQYSLLYSLQGFQYCALLLACAERAAAGAARNIHEFDKDLREVEQRTEQTLAWVIQNRLSLLTVALDHLTLGRVHLYRALLHGVVPDGAEPEIEKAAEGLRRAGDVEFLVRGLLTRAWLRFAQNRPDAARADLDEAEQIARRGPMPLFLADIALYRTRFFHDRTALAEARRLIDYHGYGRRIEEAEALEAASDGWTAA